MKCYKCKHYRENSMENECMEFGFYCFQPYYKKDCPYVDENCNVNETGINIKEYL